jgi:hypothetical protein
VSACEKCWRDAYNRAYFLGQPQAEAYRELLEERMEHPCTPLEARGEVECPHCLVVYPYGDFHMCEDTQESQS